MLFSLLFYSFITAAFVVFNTLRAQHKPLVWMPYYWPMDDGKLANTHF